MTSHLIFSGQLYLVRWPFIRHSSGFPTVGAGWQCSRAKFFLSGWSSRARRRLVFEIAQWVSAWVQIDVRPVPALSAGPGSRTRARIGWRTGIQLIRSVSSGSQLVVFELSYFIVVTLFRWAFHPMIALKSNQFGVDGLQGSWVLIE